MSTNTIAIPTQQINPVRKPRWKPKPTTTTRITWSGVLCGSAWIAEPGIRHLAGTTEVYGQKRTIEILEYRNEDGLLHGVATWEAERFLFIMVDPACRRQGIATKLMQEAKRWPIDFERQSYTPDGAKFFRTFLKEV